MSTQMNPEAVERAARLLLAARRGNYQIDPLPEDCRPTTVEAAHAVADRLVALGGTGTVGWLLGLTNPYMQAIFGTDGPYARPILAGNLHRCPAAFPAGAFLTRGLECEVAFRLGRDLPARAAPYAEDEVADAVGAMHGSIEVVNAHFRDWLTLDLPLVIADNGTDGALILGPAVEDWRDIDRPGLPVVLAVDGAPVGEGRGDNAMGDPLKALVWLANELSRRGRGLAAADVVNTGTCIEVQMVPEGSEAVADFGPLGTVQVAFGRTGGRSRKT